MIKTVALLFIAITFCYGYKQCCRGGETGGSTKKCQDGSPMDLSDCQKYILPVNETETTVDKNDNLLIEDEVITTDKYCHVTLRGKNEAVREVFIICIPDDLLNENQIHGKIMIFFLFVSVIFFFLTIVIYLMLPQMMDLQGICTVHSLVGLMVGYIVLMSENLSVSLDKVKCHLTAYSLYTSFLYAFFWLNLCCFNVWRLVVKPKILKSIKNWKLIYHIYGIGWPLVLLFFVATVQHWNPPFFKSVHPGLTEGKCWFKTMREALIYLYTPISVLLVMNIIFFIWTARILWSESSQSSSVLKYRLRLYMTLFFVMGIQWIFEVLSAAVEYYNPNLTWIWYITDSINASIGLIIFLILVIFRKRVIRGLANRSFFGRKFRFPSKWQKAQDSECEEIEEEAISMHLQENTDCCPEQPTLETKMRSLCLAVDDES